MPNNELIPTAEVARRGLTDVATVNRWVRTGRLQVELKGPGRTGANMFDPVKVREFLLARAEKAQAEAAKMVQLAVGASS